MIVSDSPCRVGDRGSLSAMTARGGVVVRWGWERQRSSGLGARATADMGEGRSLCAVAP